MKFSNPKADYISSLIPEFPLSGCHISDPNEVIAIKFSEHELQLMNEDPNYFIQDKKILE